MALLRAAVFRTGMACLIGAGLFCSSAAAQGESCPPGKRRGGPVSLLIVDSSAKVHSFAATVKDAAVLRRDANTVIFDDGRVVTADAEAAGQHLNELGWGRRKIQLVVNFPARRARVRRAPG